MEEFKEEIRNFIARNYPEHLNGFDEGWLGFHYFKEDEEEPVVEGYHIYSEGEIFGTYLI